MRRLPGLLALLLVAIGAVAGRTLRRYRVEGRSMLRAYAPSDRLVAESVSRRWRPLRVGDVVVARQPGAGGRLDLKRIAAGPGASVRAGGEERLLGPDEWFLLGDNLDESTDSRQLGPVQGKDIVGRVWFQY